MCGESWETPVGKMTNGFALIATRLAQLHFVFATFGALPSLFSFAVLLALLGTAI